MRAHLKHNWTNKIYLAESHLVKRNKPFCEKADFSTLCVCAHTCSHVQTRGMGYFIDYFLFFSRSKAEVRIHRLSLTVSP